MLFELASVCLVIYGFVSLPQRQGAMPGTDTFALPACPATARGVLERSDLAYVGRMPSARCLLSVRTNCASKVMSWDPATERCFCASVRRPTVGDTVAMISGAGGTGVITKDDRDSTPYRIRVNGNEASVWFKETDVRLMPRFRRGDNGGEHIVCAFQNQFPRPAYLSALPKPHQYKIAVTGASGTGKSTLINEISRCEEQGTKCAMTGSTETTMEPECYDAAVQGIPVYLCDLPGGGTERFPTDSYLERMGLLYFDTVLFVIGERFREVDALIMKHLAEKGVHHFLLRAKANSAFQAAKRDLKGDAKCRDAYSCAALAKQKIGAQIDSERRQFFGTAPPQKVYFMGENVHAADGDDPTYGVLYDHKQLFQAVRDIADSGQYTRLGAATEPAAEG